MNKALELLEKHCQWLAIALGGLFLTWVLWGYILSHPAAVEVGNERLTPGTVDQAVQKNFAQPLERDLTKEGAETPPAAQANVLATFVPVIQGTESPVLALRPNWPGSLPQDIKLKSATDVQEVRELVTALPTLPPSEPADIKPAYAYVSNQPPVAAAGAQPAPVAPAPVQASDGRDVNYVFYQYIISMKALNDAFAEVKLPAPATETSVIAVKTHRREVKPDGSFGPVEVVALLKGAAPASAIPGASADDRTLSNFRALIESPASQTDMIRPEFFKVIAGEGPWDLPQELPDPADAQPAERLVQPPGPPAAREPRPPVYRGPPGGDGRPPEGAPRQRQRPGNSSRPQAQDPNAARDFSDLVGVQLAQNRPPADFPDGATPPPFMGENFGRQPIPQPAFGQPPAQPGAAPNSNALPPAVFKPANAPDFVGWTYDENVVEGRTYQYQVTYVIRNPLFGANKNIVADPQLAKPFAIESKLDDNAWSSSVTIEPTSAFFLASAGWQANSMPVQVRWEVFKRTEGKWNVRVFNVSPGDRIGTRDTRTDYTTGATLVDIRFDPRAGDRSYVLVLDATGALIERDPAVDRANKLRAQLAAAVRQGAAAPAAP